MDEARLTGLRVGGLVEGPLEPADTRAAKRLGQILDSLAGGAIAISGRPGAGKSWLLRSSISRGNQARGQNSAVLIDIVSGKEPLDIVLDMHEALAMEIVGADPSDTPRNRGVEEPPDLSAEGRVRAVARFWPIPLLVGLVLVVVSIADIKLEPTMAWGLAFCAGHAETRWAPRCPCPDRSWQPARVQHRRLHR